MNDVFQVLGSIFSTAADFEKKVKSYLTWVLIASSLGMMFSFINMLQNNNKK